MINKMSKKENKNIAVYDPQMFEMFADRITLSLKCDGSATLHIFCGNDIFDDKGVPFQTEIFQLARIHLTQATLMEMGNLVDKIAQQRKVKPKPIVEVHDPNVR